MPASKILYRPLTAVGRCDSNASFNNLSPVKQEEQSANNSKLDMSLVFKTYQTKYTRDDYLKLKQRM